LVGELHRRGAERTEAGALLLGRITTSGTRTLVAAAYYDDIDTNALAHGYVYLDRRRLGEVWAICRRSGLSVVADVHTHPGFALQSSTDCANPMVPRIGHIALILPNYARAPIDDDELGVFEYLGDSRWQTLSDRRRPRDVLRIREVA
jgi:proteasome lid subunit RPN8/RPN11